MGGSCLSALTLAKAANTSDPGGSFDRELSTSRYQTYSRGSLDNLGFFFLLCPSLFDRNFGYGSLRRGCFLPSVMSAKESGLL